MSSTAKIKRKELYQSLLEGARVRGTHTPEQWAEMKRVYHHRCLRCGEKPLYRAPLTRDHVIPISLGGSDDITNLQPLCVGCNGLKGQQIIDYRIGRQETPAAYLPQWATAYAAPQYLKLEDIAHACQ